MGNRTDIDLWRGIQTEALNREWTMDNYRISMLENPELRTLRTFLLMEGDDAVGAASIAAFRRNESIGAGHYIGLAARARGRGLGRVLMAYRYRELHKLGYEASESQTHARRVDSLRAHYSCGFRPKYRLDYWNAGADAPRVLRTLANLRVRGLHADWSAEQSARAG